MKRTRVAVVGTGWISAAHLDALARLPEVEVVAVCGRDAGRTEAFAVRHGIARWYTDAAAMMDGAVPNAVHDCTDNPSHDAINRMAIERGLHLYAEKPLSDSAADAHGIWQAAEKAGIVHALNHQYRMNAAVQEMRVRVQRGDAGRIFLAHGRYHQQGGLRETDFRPRMLERGVTWALSDIGTHWVDTACCVLGRRVERVFAVMETIHLKRTLPDGSRVRVSTDDLCCLLIAFEGGVQGTFTVSKVSAGHMNDLRLSLDGQHCSYAWAQENPMHLRIGYPDQANADLQMAAPLMDPDTRGLLTLPGGHPLGYADALLASVKEFYAAVRGDIAPEQMRCATFEDGFEGMAFVEAAVRSAQRGGWAEVER